MKIKLKTCTDPRHLAFATWSLLANNTVNKTLYILFCFIDLIVIMFYSFVLIERIHFSNFTMPSVYLPTTNSTIMAAAAKIVAPTILGNSSFPTILNTTLAKANATLSNVTLFKDANDFIQHESN